LERGWGEVLMITTKNITSLQTSPSTSRGAAYPWIVVALLWVVALLNYMDRQMLSTMKPSMQIDISELQSATNFGHLMAIFLWIYGFLQDALDDGLQILDMFA